MWIRSQGVVVHDHGWLFSLYFTWSTLTHWSKSWMSLWRPGHHRYPLASIFILTTPRLPSRSLDKSLSQYLGGIVTLETLSMLPWSVESWSFLTRNGFRPSSVTLLGHPDNVRFNTFDSTGFFLVSMAISFALIGNSSRNETWNTISSVPPLLIQ